MIHEASYGDDDPFRYWEPGKTLWRGLAFEDRSGGAISAAARDGDWDTLVRLVMQKVSDRGVGPHWSTSRREAEKWSGQRSQSYRNIVDLRVLLEATVERDAVETDPDVLVEYTLYGPEREVPLRRGATVNLKAVHIELPTSPDDFLDDGWDTLYANRKEWVEFPLNRSVQASQRSAGRREDYGGMHSPPEPDPSYPGPLHDVSAIFSRDPYAPGEMRHYMHGDPPVPQESEATIRRARGNPEAMVTIYRSLPPDAPKEINTGDWVALSRAYAEHHGMHPTDPEKDWPIISAQVAAKHVHFGGNDLVEWGYFGPPITNARVASGPDTKRVYRGVSIPMATRDRLEEAKSSQEMLGILGPVITRGGLHWSERRSYAEGFGNVLLVADMHREEDGWWPRGGLNSGTYIVNDNRLLTLIDVEVDLGEGWTSLMGLPREASMLSWRPVGESPSQWAQETDCLIVSDVRSRKMGRRYEVWVYGRLVGNRQSLADAKDLAERQAKAATQQAEVEWKRQLVEPTTVTHYYWGDTDEFSDPLTVYLGNVTLGLTTTASYEELPEGRWALERISAPYYDPSSDFTSITAYARHETEPGLWPVGWLQWEEKRDPAVDSDDEEVWQNAKGDINGYYSKVVSLRVHPAARRQGIATALWQAFEEAHNNDPDMWDPGEFTPDGAAFWSGMGKGTPTPTKRMDSRWASKPRTEPGTLYHGVKPGVELTPGQDFIESAYALGGSDHRENPRSSSVRYYSVADDEVQVADAGDVAWATESLDDAETWAVDAWGNTGIGHVYEVRYPDGWQVDFTGAGPVLNATTKQEWVGPYFEVVRLAKPGSHRRQATITTSPVGVIKETLRRVQLLSDQLDHEATVALKRIEEGVAGFDAGADELLYDRGEAARRTLAMYPGDDETEESRALRRVLTGLADALRQMAHAPGYESAMAKRIAEQLQVRVQAVFGDRVASQTDRAAGLLLLHEGRDGETRFYLTKRSDVVDDHGGTWTCPGGAMEAGEDTATTAIREFIEETGVKLRMVDVDSLGTFRDFSPDTGTTFTTHVAQSPRTFAALGSDEIVADGWFTLDEMRRLELHPGLTRNMEDVRKFLL